MSTSRSMRALALSVVVFVIAFAMSATPRADDAVVVTATRFPEKALEAAAGLSVITAARIAQSAASSLPELLSMEAGIVARDNSGSPDRQIDLRGFGITGDQNTLVLLNGQRLNEIELTTIRWSAIPLDTVERIEIMRGSGAVLYGSGASGGTINIVTKSPDGIPGVNPDRATIGVSFGTFGARETRASAAHAGEQFSASIHINDYASDNYRLNNRLEQQNINGEIRTQHRNGQIYFNFGIENQSLRLPGERTAAQLQSDPRGTGRPGDYSARDGARGAIGGTVDLGFGELAVDAGYRDSTRTALLKDYAFGIFNTYTDTRVKVWSFTPRMKVPFKAFDTRHSLVLGLDADDWDYDSRRSGSFETIGSPAANVLASQKNQAAYAQDNIEVNSTTKVTIGARLHRVRMTARDIVNPAAYASGEKSNSPRAWELAVRKDLSQPLSIYGRIGSSFRIATVDEVYSQFGGPFFDAIVTLLEPQTSSNREAGVEYRTGTFHSRIGAFDMKLNNEIQFFAPTFSNVNLPPTERRGIELETGFKPIADLSLSGNLAVTEARYRSGLIGGIDVTGKTIPLVPRNLANVVAAWQLSPGMALGGAWRYVGKQFYDNDQTNSFPTRMPAYATTDLKLTYKRGAATAGLAVTNVFDKRYYSYAIRNGAGTSFNAYPEKPRSLMLTVQYELP